MESGLARLGIKLRPREWEMLAEAIQTDRDQYDYSVLVRELSGIPQNKFADTAVLKFAKIVEANDFSREDLARFIDPENRGHNQQ